MQQFDVHVIQQYTCISALPQGNVIEIQRTVNPHHKVKFTSRSHLVQSVVAQLDHYR